MLFGEQHHHFVLADNGSSGNGEKDPDDPDEDKDQEDKQIRRFS